MKKLLFLTLFLVAGFVASCREDSGRTFSTSAIFGESSKAIKSSQTNCTITVSDSNNNGSIDNADIQTALDTARTNNQDDVVCIPAGTYNITSTLTYKLTSSSTECGKKLTIKTHNGSVILDGRNSIQILEICTSACSDDIDGDINIEGMTFKNGKNVIDGYGGGLYVATNKAKITITNNEFNSNSSYFYSFSHGGGAFVKSFSGSITLTNNTFSNNNSDCFGSGAHIVSTYSSITLKNNTFSNNIAYWSGGGAYVISTYGSITLTNNIFSNNKSDNAFGGGVYVSSNYGLTTLTNNTFSGNIAKSGGGAFVAYFDTVTLANNTFSNNIANELGGGAYVYSSSSSITLTNNTFNGNRANQYGGGVYVLLWDFQADLNFYNNILWNNTANAGGNDGDDLYVNNDGDNDNTASPINLVHNLFSTSTPSIDFSTAPQTGKVYISLAGNYNKNITNGCTNSGQYGNIQADPLFADADLHLQASSPAINAGCNNAPSIPSEDKNGNQRIFGTVVDIGAYEYQGQQQYVLTVNKSGNGSGNVSATGCSLSCAGNTCTCTANAGTQITISASADSDSTFAGWSNGTGSASSCTGTGSCTITLNQNTGITATFSLKQYTITASASPSEGGSITCTPNPVNHGQTATCTITTNTNYTLQSVGGTCGGTLSGNTYTTNPITSNCTIVANFNLKQYTLTVNKSGTGSGTVTSNPSGINCGFICSANFDANTTVTLTAMADQNSTFAGWGGDCSSCGNNTTCQVNMTSVKTCTATFNLQQSGGGSQPQPQPGTGQSGGGGGGCSMGSTTDVSMLWWLVPPVIALARRLRRSA